MRVVVDYKHSDSELNQLRIASNNINQAMLYV